MTSRPARPSTTPAPPGKEPDPQQRRRNDRFLPEWLRLRGLRSVPPLRWVPGRRGSDPELEETLELETDVQDEEIDDDDRAVEDARDDDAQDGVVDGAPPALWRSPVRWRALWSRHLQLRMVVQTTVLAVLATAIVGAVLAGQVSDRLLEARRAQADLEAARATSTFTALLNSAAAANADAVQQSVREGLSRLDGSREDSGASGGILLLRSPGRAASPVLQPGFFSGELRVDVVPEILRERVQESGHRQSLSISVLDLQTRQTYPGLIVGQSVDIPLAGKYELYFVSSLQREQQTLVSVQRMLALGMLGLVVLLGLVAYLVSRLVVIPVGAAAAAAERLAEGNLDERLPVRGGDELARLAASFNDMAAGLQTQIEQLEELSRVQQRFVSDVSHELRTPLTTMRMAGEMIFDARQDLPPAAQRSAELLARQLDRFDLLLADLLEISRFDAGAAALDAELTDLTALVERVVDAAGPLVERRGTRIRIHRSGEPVTAEIDRRRIERVLRNLVDNAVEHCEGMPIDIWLGADESAAAVLVRDYGVGLSRDEAPRVFDKFWRADPARARTTGGTGLGLAISAEDALLHGGRLEVWGRRGRGAAFRLTVPRAGGGRLTGSPLPLGRVTAPLAVTANERQ